MQEDGIETMSFYCSPIGWVDTHFKRLEDVPRRIPRDDENAKCVIHILPEYREGIIGFKSVKSVYIICWFDKSKRDVLKVRPRRELSRRLVGVFCSRSPERPNPIAVTFANVLDVTEDTITVTGLDVLDGTPVLDLKPAIEANKQ